MVNQYKLKMAEELEKEMKENKVIGIVDVNKLPSSQYQELRKKLRDKINLRVVKKRVLLKVMEKLGLPEKLQEYVKKAVIVGLLTTHENAFRLYKLSERSKSMTFAKPGDIAPQDIIVPEGDTGIPPGPIISEFKAAGIKARIQGNSIVVQEDSLIAKEGEVIDEQKANILMKLNIKPIPIGLNILAMYEDGVVYDKSILAVDEQEYYDKIAIASTQAFNLAYNVDYYTSEVVKLKISDLHVKALNLAYNAEIYAKEVIELLISKANNSAMGVASSLDDETKKTLGINITASHVPSSASPTGESTSQPQQEEKKEEKKEDKKSEEEAAAGLGALFG